MGLDQYAYARKEAIATEVDFESLDTDETIFTWRKHPNLQGWMENLYTEKGGKEESFNCVNVHVSKEDLDRLRVDVLNDKLPYTEGFFFGNSIYEDYKDTLEFIQKAQAYIASGHAIYYSSWW